MKAKGSEILGLNNALVRLKKEVEERCARCLPARGQLCRVHACQTGLHGLSSISANERERAL